MFRNIGWHAVQRRRIEITVTSGGAQVTIRGASIVSAACEALESIRNPQFIYLAD